MQMQELWRELWDRLRERGSGNDDTRLDDATVLDEAFLERTFKDVYFPADKEMVLRYVDMEQDFVYGQDRTINLHNLISRLGPECFISRKALLHGVRSRLEEGQSRRTS